MRWLLLSIILGIFNSAFAQKSEKQVLADSLHNQAVELSIQEKKDTALVLMERVLKLRLEAGIDYLFVKSISDKIEMQRGLPDLEGALKTIEKADSFVQKAQETAYNADYYTRKAAVLYELKDKEGALKAVIESRRVSIAQKDSLNRLRNLTVEGAIYRDMGKLPKATRVLKQLRYYAKRDGRNDHLAMSDYNLAQVYFDLEMIDSAKVFIDEFFEIENNAAGPVINELMMEYNAKIYRLKNDYKKADEAMQELMNMRMKRMEELEVRKVDETKIKSENEIMRLKRKELKAKNERNNIFYLSLVIILLLIVTGAIYRHNNIKKAHNLQQSINEELNRSVEFKNRLLSILAHDIRNPINGLTGIISIFKDDTLDEDEFKTLTAKLEGTMRNVSLLLKNILNWIKAQGKGFDVRLSEFSLVELITEVEKQNSAELDRKSIEIIKKLDKIEGFIKSDYNMVSLIVRNVIANAIKFTPKNNSIEVSYASTNRFHNIIINDHGVGMTEDQLQGLFNTTSSALGTNNEGGTGLGLTLCFDIIKELNGKIEVESERERGQL